MAMKNAADLLVTQLESITSPSAPNKVQKVPPGHGDDRPRVAKNASWINLEPTGQDRSDEANRSGLRQFQFMAHYWVSSVKHDLADTSDIVMDMADSIMDKIQHNTLGGWARQGITVDTFESEMQGGEDDDTLYVVRLGFTVWRQET